MEQKSKKTNIIWTAIISFVLIATTVWSMASADETTPFSFCMHIVLIVGIVCAGFLYISYIRDYKPDEDKTDTPDNLEYKNPFQKNDKPQAEPKEKEIKFLTSVSLVKSPKGIIAGVIGTVLTVALWSIYIFGADITVIQAQMVNAYTLTAAAALVSLFGLFFRDASSMLLAGVALVGAFLMDAGTFVGLVPAVLLMVSHVQMKNSIGLKTKRDTIEIKQD